MEGLRVQTTVFKDLKVSFKLKFKSEDKLRGHSMDFERVYKSLRLYADLE